jgi:hypothetical protein
VVAHLVQYTKGKKEKRASATSPRWVTVSRTPEPLGLTVAVVGTDVSAVVDSSGYFQIGRVPSGNVQLRFKDAAIDATAQLLNVVQDEFIEVQVHINGGSAIIVNEIRSSGKISLCHRTDSGKYHLIDVSVNAEPAHRAHGDGKVGEPVPGTQKQVFDERSQRTAKMQTTHPVRASLWGAP